MRLHLVRHGEAAEGWGSAADPGLSALGQRQARAVSERFSGAGARRLLVSPMRRTRETAEPLARRWGVEAFVEPRVSEVPSPIDDPTARSVWLRDVLSSRWSELDTDLLSWRDRLADCLLAAPADTVVVSHFVAINAIVGLATGDDRVVSFRPGNASVTVVDIADGRFRLVELGDQGATQVH